MSWVLLFIWFSSSPPQWSAAVSLVSQVWILLNWAILVTILVVLSQVEIISTGYCSTGPYWSPFWRADSVIPSVVIAQVGLIGDVQ